jgi:hypothetical protein
MEVYECELRLSQKRAAVCLDYGIKGRLLSGMYEICKWEELKIYCKSNNMWFEIKVANFRKVTSAH